jgi:hypothetical protein
MRFDRATNTDRCRIGRDHNLPSCDCDGGSLAMTEASGPPAVTPGELGSLSDRSRFNEAPALPPGMVARKRWILRAQPPPHQAVHARRRCPSTTPTSVLVRAGSSMVTRGTLS